MANERYLNRRVLRNRNLAFSKIFENRDMGSMLHYETPAFRYPTVDEIATLVSVSHTWQIGDRYWRLASQHYSDPGMWWVIAWFNKKPTESHVKFGENIYIPFPLERILQYYDVV